MRLRHKANINPASLAPQGGRARRPFFAQGCGWGLWPCALALVVAAPLSLAQASPPSQAKQKKEQSEQKKDPTKPSLEAEALTEEGTVPIESKVDPDSGYRVPNKENKSDKSDNNGHNGSNGGKGGKASPNSDGEQKSGAEDASVDGNKQKNKQKRVQQTGSNSTDDASTSPKNGTKQNKGNNGKNQTSGPASQGPGGPKGGRQGREGKSPGTQGQQQKGQGESATAKGGQGNGVKQGKVDKVEKAAQKKQKSQHDAAYYYRLGKRAIENERIKKGIAYLHKSWQLDSSKDNVRTAKLMAKTYGHYQAQEQALAWYRRVLEREPTFFPAHLYRAKAKDTIKAWRAALNSLDHKGNLPYEPHRGKIHLELGRLRLQKGESVKAQKHWQKALQSQSSRPQGLLELGRLHFHRGEDKAARHYLGQYEKWRQNKGGADWPAAKQKDFYDMLLTLAQRAQSGQSNSEPTSSRQEITRIYQKFLELDYKSEKALDYLAAEAYRQGHWPKVIHWLKNKKNRGLELSRKQREHLAQAYARIKPHEKNKSLEIYAALEQDYPQESSYLLRQARLFRELGYQQNAVQKYHQLYDKTGGGKETLAYLFNWHHKQRHWRQALLYGGKLLLSLKPGSKEAASVRRKLCTVHLNRARATAPAIFGAKPSKQSKGQGKQQSGKKKSTSRRQRALKQIHQCLKLSPEHKQASKMKKRAARYPADAAWAEQKYGRAHKLYDNYLADYPDDKKAAQKRRQALKRHALAAYKGQDYPKAIDRIRRYLQDYPVAEGEQDSVQLQKKLYQAHYHLGYRDYDQGRYSEAAHHLQTWLKGPQSGEASPKKQLSAKEKEERRQQKIKVRLTIAAAQHKLGRFLKERDALTKILEKEPGHREALEALIYIYWRKIHNPPKLKRYSSRLLRSHPDHPRRGFYRTLARPNEGGR